MYADSWSSGYKSFCFGGIIFQPVCTNYFFLRKFFFRSVSAVSGVVMWMWICTYQNILTPCFGVVLDVESDEVLG